MKKLCFFLFFAGLGISVVGFFCDHAARIPFVMRMIAPTYSRAESGIEKLKQQRLLRSTNEGFGEISRILIGYVEEMNGRPKDYPIGHTVTRLECMGETLSRGTPKGDVLYSPDDIRFELTTVTNWFVEPSGKLSKTMQFYYHIAELQSEVDNYKELNLFKYSMLMFWLGLVIAAVAFLLEHWKPNDVQPLEQPKDIYQTQDHPANR